MKPFITLFLFLLITNTPQAQPRIYIGAEIAWSADILSHTDFDGYIKGAPLNSALYGINCRFQLAENFFVETGVYARAYKLGIGFSNGDYTSGTDRTGAILPFRAGARIPFFKGAIALTPVAGISLGITDEGEPFDYDGGHSYDGIELYYRYTPQYSTQVLALLQAGAGLDIRVGKRALITANTNYYGGLSTILTQNITYSVNNGAEKNATISGKGSFYSIGLGFRYRI